MNWLIRFIRDLRIRVAERRVDVLANAAVVAYARGDDRRAAEFLTATRKAQAELRALKHPVSSTNRKVTP